MKKLVILLVAGLLLTGCFDVKTEISIDNNDTGRLVYTTAIVYDEEMEFLEDSENEFTDYEGAVIRDVEYTKNGDVYTGEEVTIEFNSLEELNEVLLMIFGGEEAEGNIAFERVGDRVSVFLPSDSDEFEEMFDGSEEEIYDIYDFQFIVQVEGTVIEHNADNFNESTNTLTWETQNWLQNGVDFVYDTGVGSPDISEPIIDEDDSEAITEEESDTDRETSSFNPLHLAIIGGAALIIGGIVYFKKK